MKTLRLFFCLVITALFFSCQEEDPAPNTLFDTQKEAITWKEEKPSEIRLFKGGGIDSLFISGYNENGRIHMGVRFSGVGTYTSPEKFTAYYSLKNSQGQVINTYYTDPKANGSTLVVTEWNPQTKAIKGTFQVTLDKKYSNGSEEAAQSPKTITLTGGVFEGTATEVQ
ncbi:DUF6252 family protein [Sabulibacter ruber]|uniref:DUF6252 family protein n=1 Tax=Sabulibacter ruber TaxID=2811901 RepID=UPI001A97B834|nr:DUF6252 family protein [Sabulibacter ruber]